MMLVTLVTPVKIITFGGPELAPSVVDLNLS